MDEIEVVGHWRQRNGGKGPRDPFTMSDANDHQQLLQILEAHGQQFLNSFGQLQKPSSSKRKLEESDDSSGSGEEAEEWHGFGTGEVGSDDSGDGDSIISFRGALHSISPHPNAYERRL
jgi:hypothetical protein